MFSVLYHLSKPLVTELGNAFGPHACQMFGDLLSKGTVNRVMEVFLFSLAISRERELKR